MIDPAPFLWIMSDYYILPTISKAHGDKDPRLSDNRISTRIKHGSPLITSKPSSANV